MAADRDDKPGVLGNLPRSRPGQRSTKRDTGSATRKARTSSARSAASTKRSTTPTTAKKRSTSTASTPPPRPRRAPAASTQSTDPLGQAVQLAGKVATVGLKTAAGIVKRLPRP